MVLETALPEVLMTETVLPPLFSHISYGAIGSDGHKVRITSQGDGTGRTRIAHASAHAFITHFTIGIGGAATGLVVRSVEPFIRTCREIVIQPIVVAVKTSRTSRIGRAIAPGRRRISGSRRQSPSGAQRANPKRVGRADVQSGDGIRRRSSDRAIC